MWTYERPTEGFKDIKDHLSFYAGPWECYVDGEKVEPQPGDFYGGWVTSEIQGKIKGGPGKHLLKSGHGTHMADVRYRYLGMVELRFQTGLSRHFREALSQIGS